MQVYTHLSDKQVLLGITGGIAAYKAAELVRLLVKQGCRVQVVMTEAATRFITPLTLQALSGLPVYTDSWDASIANGMPHIELSRAADLILIAPASADFMAKLAHGFANDLLSTLCLARDCPLLLAPAMNKQMWENAATQRNVQQLQQDGVRILGPDSGAQACGETGHGRMLEAQDLLEGLACFLTPKLLTGKKVLITAGATLEMLDPVRGITNLSSGKMGFALARAAAHMGADVTLVHAHTTAAFPTVLHAYAVSSASDMYQTVMQHIGQQDVFISVAAVADYRPTHYTAEKIKKEATSLSLALTRNPDILAEVAKLPQAPYCIGFAAETTQVIAYAREKRMQKKIPMIVANHAPSAMGSDDNTITIIEQDRETTLGPANKTRLAQQLLEHLSLSLRSRTT